MVVSHYCRVSGYFTGLGVGGGKWSGEKSYLFRLKTPINVELSKENGEYSGISLGAGVLTFYPVRFFYLSLLRMRTLMLHPFSHAEQ